MAKARSRDERAFCALLRSERVGLGELYKRFLGVLGNQRVNLKEKLGIRIRVYAP